MHGARAALAIIAGLTLGSSLRAEPDHRRGAFIRAHRCAIVARLDAIHRRGPVDTSRDRFITVALRDGAQHYVQCIFFDRDAAMFCEASSGAYGYAPDEAARLRQAPRSVAALQALGFRQEDPAENFSQEIRLGDPPDVGLAADLMLGALYDGYGAREGMALEFNAPHGAAARTSCGTPAS